MRIPLYCSLYFYRFETFHTKKSKNNANRSTALLRPSGLPAALRTKPKNFQRVRNKVGIAHQHCSESLARVDNKKQTDLSIYHRFKTPNTQCNPFLPGPGWTAPTAPSPESQPIFALTPDRILSLAILNGLCSQGNCGHFSCLSAFSSDGRIFLTVFHLLTPAFPVNLFLVPPLPGSPP